ncbi:MAG: hypothetical protein H6728_08760 [Myxococcales bacterium]|nr:hypothetical protein [Myxococcales bacterium]
MSMMAWLGLLLLVIMWVNALLIAAAAWIEMRDIEARASSWESLPEGTEGEGLLFVRIEAAEQGKAFATQSVEQSGHAMQAKASHRRIGWWDRLHDSSIAGGRLSWGEHTLEVPSYASPIADVWPSRQEQEEAAAHFSMVELDEIYEKAAKPRGVRRSLQFAMEPGQEVWVSGRVAKEGQHLRLYPDKHEKVLVSSVDPRVWLIEKRRLVWFFMVSELTLCALCTVMCLWPPVFTGWISRLGGAAFLAFFLGVQPLGTVVRDALRPPSWAFLHGAWEVTHTPKLRHAPKTPQ